MRLSKKAIKEYKEIYKKEFGEKLTDTEAQEQGQNLLRFFKTLIEIEGEKNERDKKRRPKSCPNKQK